MSDLGLLVLQMTLLGLVWGGVYAVTGSGLNLIFGVMKVLNVAHGEFMMLGAYLAVIAFTAWGVSPLWSCVVAGVGGFGVGYLLHRTVIGRLTARAQSLRAMEQLTLIAFFALLLIIQHGVLLGFSADFQSIDYLSTPVSIFGASLAMNRIVVFAVALALCLALQLYLSRTMFGRALRAVSQDRDVSLLMGINTRAVDAVGFGLGVALAAMGGALLPMIFVITPTIGVLFTVRAFVVVILGGVGSQLGTLVAGLGIGLFESLCSLFTGERYREAMVYVLLVGYVLATAPWLSRAMARR